mgnify:CR=1 FL=1
MNNPAVQDAIESMELLDLYLNDSQVQRSRDFDLHYPIDEMRQQSKLSVSGELLSKQAEDGGADELNLRAFVSFGLRFVRAEEDADHNDEKPLSELSATFAVIYRMSRELPDETIQAFIQYNVIHNAWPFWREHALRTASEAKIPRPHIGLFKPKSP